MEQINAHVWTPGAMLPSEAELCAAFDVSRTVIRQALQEMEQSGIIYRRQGKGSFVAERKVYETFAQQLTGFYHDMINQGHRVVNQVLKQDVVSADNQIAAALDIAPDAAAIICTRLRYVDDVPVNLSISHVPFDACQPLLQSDLTERSLYDLIESITGKRIMGGKRIIEAVLPSAELAELLDVTGEMPLFKLTTVCYLEDGTPIEHAVGYHRGDRSRFDVELIRASMPSPQAANLGIKQLSSLPHSFTLLQP
ncbi:MAG: GntR family transcriptional regulator [Caldilineaceae bacterium]|nr:GntR family transcriptional regulator [Caldilineaceae bacterium]